MMIFDRITALRNAARKLLVMGLCSLLAAPAIVAAHPGQHEQLQQASRNIERHPKQQAMYIRRGAIYSTGGEYEQALADFETAEELGPSENVALERGIAYYRMNKPELANQYLSSYIESFPTSSIAYEYRARVARQAGDAAAAVADLQQYFALQDHPNPGAYISAANILHELGDTQQALALLDKGLDKLGINPQLQRQAIALELESGNADAAITRLQSLQAPLKNSPTWKLQMAELLQSQQDWEQAEQLLDEVELQLKNLRTTPANLKLQQRVLLLRKARPVQISQH